MLIQNKKGGFHQEKSKTLVQLDHDRSVAHRLSHSDQQHLHGQSAQAHLDIELVDCAKVNANYIYAKTS